MPIGERKYRVFFKRVHMLKQYFYVEISPHIC